MANAGDRRADRITAADVQGRREAAALACNDEPRALDVARAIRHPWYRCQALTGVAESAPSSTLREVLAVEALAAAFEQTEPNRIVCAASWPLRLMVRTTHPATERAVVRLLNVIAKEDHGLRRLDGLASVLGPLIAMPGLRAKAWRPFLAAAQASTGWRTERLVSWMAVALAAHDKAAAQQLLAGRSANRFTDKARTEIAALEARSRR